MGGSTAFKQDRERSITLKNILPVCSVPGPKYFSVQKSLRDGDAAILSANPQILQLGQDLTDFQETAAAMLHWISSSPATHRLFISLALWANPYGSF